MIISNICEGVHVPVHWVHHSGRHHRGGRAFCCLPQGSPGQLDHDADDDDDQIENDDRDDDIDQIEDD